MRPFYRIRYFRNRKGFTLMEVLLVLAILGVIMSMVVPQLLGRQAHASADATRLSIRGVEQAIKLYMLDHAGNFPASSDGLVVLVESPGQRDPRWRGPYLDQLPLDAWGTPLTYVVPGRRNKARFDVVSSGPDRQLGTDDDLGNWTNDQHP